MLRQPRQSTLFPYTTLFRSPRKDPQHRHHLPVIGSKLAFQRGPRFVNILLMPMLHGCAFPGCSTQYVLNVRSEEHTSELQSHHDLVCRLLLEKKKTNRSSAK